MNKPDVTAPVRGITSHLTNIRSPAMSSTKNSAFVSTVTAFLGLVVVALPHAALAYNAATDFSLGGNPNGTWNYGWSSTLASAFTPDTNNTTAAYGQSGLEGWLGTDTDGVPSILYNSTASSIFIGGHTTFQPGQLALNPGTIGEYCVLRWIAPSSGQFTIAATFSGLSTVGATVDVHILLDGTSIFNSTVVGTPAPTSYSGVTNLVMGDTVSFAVGWGSNGNQHDDTTVLSATVVPEPETIRLVGVSLGCMLLLPFLKRR